VSTAHTTTKELGDTVCWSTKPEAERLDCKCQENAKAGNPCEGKDWLRLGMHCSLFTFTTTMDAGRRPLRAFLAFTLFSFCAQTSWAQSLTIYDQIPLYQQRANAAGTETAAVPGVQPTQTLPAYDRTRLIPPALPQPMPATTYTLELPLAATGMQGLSAPHVGGGFYGFSIEMSVLSQVGASCLTILPPSF